ncbi:MAG: hypothetical protein JWO38_2300 [Gemmataceae bacterium]|nr:hypothetical protein [Gemmataceae bacterium]
MATVAEQALSADWVSGSPNCERNVQMKRSRRRGVEEARTQAVRYRDDIQGPLVRESDGPEVNAADKWAEFVALVRKPGFDPESLPPDAKEVAEKMLRPTAVEMAREGAPPGMKSGLEEARERAIKYRNELQGA